MLAASYPSTHAVRAMVEDDNFAQTWYVFWVLPLGFILLNLFMIPRYQTTLQTGRVLQGYIVLSIAASGAASLVQHDFPSDGEQPQPQRKITAGKPAAFHAAAAL